MLFELLATAALLQQAPDPRAIDGGDRLEHPSLETHVQAGPDSARAWLSRLLRTAATLPDGQAAAVLDTARLVGEANARVWGDSFPLLTVRRFVHWGLPQRLGKVRADSFRQAGNDAFAREGPRVALTLWARSVTVAEEVGDSAGVAAGWGNMGSGWLALSEPDSAKAYLESSRRLAAGIEDHRTAGNALGSLANVAKAEGRLAEARALYRTAGRYRERSADSRGRAADLNNLGLIAETLGELDSAASLYRRALVLNREFDRQAPAAANLVNLGNVAAMRGRYAEAAESYTAALRIRRSRGEKPEQATVLYDLGLLDVRRGDYPSAERHLRESAALYQESGLLDGAVSACAALSNLYVQIGRVQDAFEQLRAAEGLAAGEGIRVQTVAELALIVAEADVALNDLAGAERHYDRAAQLYGKTTDVNGQAAAVEGLGVLLLHRKPVRAHRLFQQADSLRASQGDLRAMGMTRLLAGHAQLEMDSVSQARLAYDSALAVFRRLADPVGQGVALEALGRLEMVTGSATRAEARFSDGLDRVGMTRAPALSWRLRAGMAEALQRRGRSRRAARILEDAIAEIEQVRGLIPLDEWRAGYLADKWSVYGQLVALEQELGRPAAAFAASERMRARQMLDQLSRGRVEPAALPPGIAREEQDLRTRITELATTTDEPRWRRSARREVLGHADRRAGGDGDLVAAQAAHARLLARIRETSAMYAGLVSGATVSLETARSRLHPGELLLDYMVLDSTTIVFALTREGLRSFEVSISRGALAALVDFTRDVIAGTAAARSREPWRAPLRRLDRLLMGAVDSAGLLDGKHRLIIVPHAELHYLPFAALLRPGPKETFLVERFEISYAPSVSLWVRLRDRSTRSTLSSILSVAPRPATLPGSRTEVAAIRRLFGDRATVLMDSAANEGAFRRAATQYDIVHLATYGVLNKRNPLYSYVQLEPLGRDDGRLEVHEAYGLSLRAPLLVLSACETGLAAGALEAVPPGDDWIGLVQAFLHAGAGSVLATLWAVDDRATSTFMTAFYEQVRDTRRVATALAQAQRLALHRRESRSPLYWAGFALTGGTH
jgi:CHAT domain-containing protein/tetratricopeptide (TPR) repeat protein